MKPERLIEAHYDRLLITLEHFALLCARLCLGVNEISTHMFEDQANSSNRNPTERLTDLAGDQKASYSPP